MTLLFADSFDGYATAQLAARYNVRSGMAITAAAGRNSTAGLTSSDHNEYVGLTVGNKATVIVGGAWYWTSVGSLYNMVDLYDGASIQIYLQVDAGGILRVKRGDGTLLATSAQALLSGAWYYIEIKATINNATGAVAVNVNGHEWVNVSGIDTQYTANAYVSLVKWHVYGKIDDIYICDDAGGVNDNFLGVS